RETFKMCLHCHRTGRPVRILLVEHPLVRYFVDQLHQRAGVTHPDGEPVKELVGELARLQERVGHRLPAEVNERMQRSVAEPALEFVSHSYLLSRSSVGPSSMGCCHKDPRIGWRSKRWRVQISVNYVWTSSGKTGSRDSAARCAFVTCCVIWR